MERILLPYGAPAGTPSGRFAPVAPAAPAAIPPKTPADYARALRRRLWLALGVALAVIVPGAIAVLRMPDVYRAVATIVIEPPAFNEAVASILPHGAIGQLGAETMAKYVPNRIANLRSRWLAERVLQQDATVEPPSVPDPVSEVVGNLNTRQMPNSNNFEVTLELQEPEKAAKILNALLEKFEALAQEESVASIRKAREYVQANQEQLDQDMKAIDETIVALLKSTPIFTAQGGNLLEQQFLEGTTTLRQRRLRFDELAEQERIARNYPSLRGGGSGPHDQKVAELMREKAYWTKQAQNIRRIAKNFDRDPSARHVTQNLRAVMDELQQLQSLRVDREVDMVADLKVRSSEEVRRLEGEVKGLLYKMQESLPAYYKYLAMLRRREQTERGRAELETRLGAFEMLTKTKNDPVVILHPAPTPIDPVRPKRTMYLVLIVLAGLGLGAGLVCLLEAIDRRVKVPEHLTAGLTLPLFGVVPRMRRLAAIHRGGHLWTPGAPASIEADAYRNLRASLVGSHGARGRPIVTLMVTSAKAGEGKSTTALNLAATCARAGERTLLMDVDLRRPSLAEVFGAGEGPLGLVDVLRGEMPWQRAVMRTDIANLDFLPAGDPAGIPVEILGTIELRQLIAALSGHYHRVILDAPAVLGLADCRMLGRLVDAALLVVRSGAHELSPLQRAKAMLEQSSVRIAGVVFNGLDEDLKNWSSHGPGFSPGYGDAIARLSGRGLDAPAVVPSA